MTNDAQMNNFALEAAYIITFLFLYPSSFNGFHVALVSHGDFLFVLSSSLVV